MALSLHAVRNAIPSTSSNTLSSDAQFLIQQPSNYEQGRLNLFGRSRISPSTDIRVARSSPRVYKHVEPCSPYTNLSSTLFNSKGKNWKHKHRRSSIQSPSILRCETERREQDNIPSEQTPGHDNCTESKCERENHHHSEHDHIAHSDQSKKHMSSDDHTPDHGHHQHSDHHHVREWKDMRDAYSECARRHDHEHHEGEECKDRKHDVHTHRREGELCRACSLRGPLKGYFIRVSRELMGLFCYIEKRKRSMIRELAQTLRQIAAVAVVLTCVRGILAPLVEVFKTTPPTWSKLLLMLVSIDSIAICYFTMKSVEPLEQLANLATENRPNIMEGVEKEEEMILHFAMEFIRLFKRLRNIAISITVSQMVQLIFTVLKLKDPDIIAKCSRIVRMCMLSPWT
ncbi:hypothetical protein M758_5G056900 [Ceratodon purpureus]|nr:hypothetical protein M758_5G056900 [Ceratodon purpureus]